jgi:tetratricopeptide (TPR) repeat protein
MKSLYKLIIGISCLFAFSSCEGYLDVDQPSIYTDQNYYKTPQDFETAINGCYAQLQTIYNKNYLEAIVTRADEVRNSSPIGRFMDTPMESRWSKPWSSWWTLVFRCNQLLSRIDAVTFTDEDRKKHITGEAYALRGLAYLQFAWCWGGAPLITKEITREEVYKVKRSSQEDTYGQAISDFKDAFNRLPESWASSEVGRVTKYAAAGMLGRTYMYMRDYATAAEYLSQVVAKEGTLYKLADKYEDCFSDVYNNDKERVWEVQYLGGTAGKALGLSQSFSGWFIPSTLNKDKGDYEKLNGITFIGASGSIRASMSLAGDGVYEENDKRRDLTIVNNLYGDKSTPQPDVYYVRKFLRATKNAPTAVDEWGNNIPILRYTDVKLMYAEALNEVNYSANLSEKILPIINDVRKRAGLTAKVAEDFPDKQSVFDYLVKERFVEFCFEGIRWPDLIRWDLAEDAMKAHFALKDEGYNETSEQPLYSMRSYYKLAPIPLSDILAYGNKEIMWQNDGY